MVHPLAHIFRKAHHQRHHAFAYAVNYGTENLAYDLLFGTFYGHFILFGTKWGEKPKRKSTHSCVDSRS